MSQASLIYPFRVWTLTNAIGPMPIILREWAYSENLMWLADCLPLYLGCVLIGLVLSVPVLSIVVFIYDMILRHFEDLRTIKVIIVLCTLVMFETSLIAIGLIGDITFAELSGYPLVYIVAMLISAFVLDIGEKEQEIEEMLV